jgi:branched-chain amino acid transport system ATP-binding protein
MLPVQTQAQASATAVPINAPLLRVQGACKRFGGVQALSDAYVQVEPGQVVGLIGPNGAGKTTFFNVMTGLYTPDAGTFELEGRPYEPRAVHQVVRAGIARTFQNIRLFSDMSVLDNVRVAQHARTRAGVWDAVFRTKAFWAEEERIAQQAHQCLDFVGLGAMADRKASTLSYGDQRRLEVARALATGPKLLALDEPAAGMNATEKRVLRELIGRIRDSGCAVLLIEHDVKLVMGLCDRVTVLDYGRVIVQGTPDVVQSHPQVIEAYLGTRHTAVAATQPHGAGP